MMMSAARKVAFLTTADNLGGMERVVCGLSRQFSSRGWEVRTLFPQSSRVRPLLQWAQELGVDAEAHPALLGAHAPHSARDVARLRRYLRHSAPDIVNLHYGYNVISLKDVLAVRLAGKRCHVTVHQAADWEPGPSQKKVMTRLAGCFAHTVIAICGATRKMLRQVGVPDRRIRVIPCGVVPPEDLPGRPEARRRMGIAPEAFVVVCVAHLYERKGIATLIEGAARIPDPQRQLLVVVAGEGPERPSLERLIRERMPGRVRLLGRVQSGLEDVYASGDVFALASRQEGLPLVYLEAAFHGIPSIGTDVGGTAEVVVNGKTGLLIPPGDPEAFSGAIRSLRDSPDLRRRLGDTARSHVYAEWTDLTMADRYERLFTSAA